MNRRARVPAGVGAVALMLMSLWFASGRAHAGGSIVIPPRQECGVAGGLPCGKFTNYAVPYASPHGIVYDNSGNSGPLKSIWFTNRTLDATSGAVEFSYQTGKTRFHATPTAAALPGSINFEPDGKSLWFTESKTDNIAKIDPSLKITEYAIPTAGSKPFDIQHGPDGAMWFTESGVGKIGRIDRNGTITEFRVGAADDAPTALITQAGAMWFTETGSNRFGRLTTSGIVSHFSAGSGQLTGDITNTSDGSLWAPKSTSVVRLQTDGTLTEFPLPAGVVNTGQIFGHNDGVFMGAIKANGQGAILAVSAAGQVHEYDLPLKYLLPIEMAVDPVGGFFVTVKSYPAGHSVAMIWRLQ